MKNILFIAAFSLAAILSFSSCEKNPDGNGDGSVGETKALKSLTLNVNHSETSKLVFINDEKGRITHADVIYIVASEGYIQHLVFELEYGDDFCKMTMSEENRTDCVYQFVMKDGRAISCTYNDNRWNENHTGEYQFKYNESGHLTEILHISDNTFFPKVTTKLEWENDCMTSWYEEGLDAENNIGYRQKHVYHYGDAPSTINNFNYHPQDCPGADWSFAYMFNLFGKQYKYLPVKIEGYYSEFYPDDNFGRYGSVLNFDYEFNKDKTVSKATVKYGAMDLPGYEEYPDTIEYIFNY